MNKKIVGSIIISIVISFGLLLVVQNYFPEERIIKEREFYSQDFSSENELIFLIGSSNVGQLNTTLIHEKVSQKFPQSVVYNLSYNGDTPSERIQTIDDAISLNPKIILYGITYGDLHVGSVKKHPLPDPQRFFNDLLTDEVGVGNEINPKFTTLEIIRKTFSETGLFPPRELIILDNSPFFPFTSEQITLANDVELKQQGDQQHPIQFHSFGENIHVSNLNIMIEKFQKNKIDVIIFSVPLHQYSLDQISPETKGNFSRILEQIRNTYDITVYDFSGKYANEDIWANITHISYNKKSNIYSDDIADIIITELEK